MISGEKKINKALLVYSVYYKQPLMIQDRGNSTPSSSFSRTVGAGVLEESIKMAATVGSVIGL